MRKLALSLIAAAAWAVPPAMAQDASACKDARPIPIVATHTIPPYPPASVMTEEEGVSLLEVTIGADGKVISDSIVRSSGALRLDQAARDFVKETWLWQPAASCRPIVTRVQIAWALHNNPEDDPRLVILHPDVADWPADALKARAQGNSFVAVAISPDGKATVIDHPGSSGSASLDDKAHELAQKHQWKPAMMDGKPVGSGVVVVVEWKLPPAQ